MIIQAFTVRKKDTQKLIYAVGIEDNNSYVSFSLPIELFTNNEIKEFKDKGTAVVSATNVFFGESEVYHFLYDNFEFIDFKIEKIEVK